MPPAITGYAADEILFRMVTAGLPTGIKYVQRTRRLQSTSPSNIKAAGVIIGSYIDAKLLLEHCFLRAPGGAPTELSTSRSVFDATHRH